jgi:hypothetical protein
MSYEDHDSDAPGWEAIDDALRPLYGTQEPKHWGTIVSYALGGPDPIYGISAYRSDRQRHHLHYVTYGFSELYEKESEDPDISGFGFELTFRLACEPGDEPPNWVLSFLQNLGRYVFQTGNRFGEGHTMPLNGPIRQGADTLIRTIGFALDPELGKIVTPNGWVEFLQVVGLTEDEREAARLWNASHFLELVGEQNPLLLTDLSRDSYLRNEAFRQNVEERRSAEGSSTEGIITDRLLVQCDEASCRLVVGALIAKDLSRWLPARIPHGRNFRVETDDLVLWFEPETDLAWSAGDAEAVVSLNPRQCQALSRLLASGVGLHAHPDLPGMMIEIERTEITDNDGRVVDVIE